MSKQLLDNEGTVSTILMVALRYNQVPKNIRIVLIFLEVPSISMGFSALCKLYNTKVQPISTQH